MAPEEKPGAPEAPLIRLRGITRVYGAGEAQVRALDGLDLDIGRGEFVAIMGPSGSGKSTAMNVIGCLDRPSDGSYHFNGVEIARLTRDQRALLRRNYLGFVFQGYNLLPRTTALDNVELPLIYKGMAPEERLARARRALAQVGLEGREHHDPSQLSGGQQQRVAIARALAGSPEVKSSRFTPGMPNCSASGTLPDISTLSSGWYEKPKRVWLITVGEKMCV